MVVIYIVLMLLIMLLLMFLTIQPLLRLQGENVYKEFARGPVSREPARSHAEAVVVGVRHEWGLE